MEGASPRLILASRSPRRQQLLESAGVHPVIAPSDIEELVEHPESPRHLAMENAQLKARALASKYPVDVILAADTIVVLHGKIFGKPGNLDEASQMLSALSGETHEVVTAVCIMCQSVPAVVQFEEVTRVRFRVLSEADIDNYLRKIDPLDKAGAYAAQEDEGRIIECVEGSMSNVIGLPLERTMSAIQTHFPELLSTAGY